MTCQRERENEKPMTLFLIKKFLLSKCDDIYNKHVVDERWKKKKRKLILQDVRITIMINENDNKGKKKKSMWQVIFH